MALLSGALGWSGGNIVAQIGRANDGIEVGEYPEVALGIDLGVVVQKASGQFVDPMDPELRLEASPIQPLA